MWVYHTGWWRDINCRKCAKKGVNYKMQKWEYVIIFRESQLRWAGMKHFIKGQELKRTLDFFGCNVSGNYWPLCSPEMPFISRRSISVLKEQPAIIKSGNYFGSSYRACPKYNWAKETSVFSRQKSNENSTSKKMLLISQEDTSNEVMQRTVLQRGT